MKPSRLLFAEMTRVELRAISADTLVVLPLGATEQHGPHLPAGTDLFAIDHLTRDAATRASLQISITVAPALPFGSSNHHLIFGATLSLGSETYYRVLTEVIRSLAMDGFRRIFLINGHGGNHELAQLAARDMALELPIRVGAGSYWIIAWDALLAVNAHRHGFLPGHAGAFETSLMLALRPELVPQDRPHRESHREAYPGDSHPPYRHERHGAWKNMDGYTDSPDAATAEKGHEYRETVVAALAAAFVEFAGADDYPPLS